MDLLLLPAITQKRCKMTIFSYTIVMFYRKNNVCSGEKTIFALSIISKYQEYD